MVLRKQIIDIPISGGLDQLVHPKLLSSPSLLRLENGKYLKQGSITKQPGYTKLSTESYTPSALASWNNELLKFSGGALFTYGEATETWKAKLTAPIAKTQVTKLSGTPTAASGRDSIIQDGVQVNVWSENSIWYYSVTDLATGAQTTSRTQLPILGGAATSYPRIASLPGFIYIFYSFGGGITSRVISTASGAATNGTTYIDVDSNGQFDVYSYGSYLYFVYLVTGGGSTLKLTRLDTYLNASIANTVPSMNPNTSANLSIYVDENGPLIIASDGAGSIRAACYDLSFSVTGASTSVSTDVSVNVIAGKRCFFATVSASPARNYYIVRGNVTTTAGTDGSSVFMRSVGLASRQSDTGMVDIDGLGREQIVVLYDSPLQATYFVISSTFTISTGILRSHVEVAKFYPGEGPTQSDIKRPSNFMYDSATNASYLGLLRKGRIESQNGTLYASLTPNVGKVTTDSSYITLSQSSGMYLAGGIARNYDGESLTEYGFNLYPESVSLAESTTGPGLVPNGTYLVQALYEWTDAQGVRQQSAPSVASSITPTGMNNTITVTVPSLRVTSFSGDVSGTPSRTSLLVKAYISTNNGTVLYYAGQATNPDILTTDNVSIVLTADPAGLTANEILYTAGGTIENIAAPSHGYAFTHNNHIVITDLEDEHQVRFSKDIKPLTGVGFTEDFSINLDPIGGRCVGGATLNGAMVILKQSATYVIPGEFPNDLGQGSSLGIPRQLSGTIGCRDPKSIIETPTGIYFMSNQGIYLLDNQWNLKYIGGPVSDYESNTVLAATSLISAREIRFLLDNGITLCLNLTFDRWTTSTTRGAIDAVNWRNSDYVYCTESKVLVEDSTTYLNDGSYVPMTIRTSWIHLAGLQGYQRIFWLGLLGTYYTNNSFYIKLRYDYSDIIRETQVITAGDLVNTTTWGDSSTWGSDSYWGGSQQDEVYQLRKSPIRQKCESISIELSDAPNGNSNGQGYSLESISLVVGGIGGIFRNSATRTK